MIGAGVKIEWKHGHCDKPVHALRIQVVNSPFAEARYDSGWIVVSVGLENQCRCSAYSLASA